MTFRMSARPRLRNPVVDLRPFAVRLKDDPHGETAFQEVRSRFPHTSSEKARLLRRAKDILYRNDLDVGEKIGSGTTATVFALRGYPEWVVKITFDPTDAVVMSEMMHVRLAPGIPDVAGVYDLGEGTYAILIERMKPLTGSMKRRIADFAEEHSFGWSHSEREWERMRRQEPDAPEFAFLNAVRVLRALGFRSTDLSEDNMMMRKDGSIVGSDFGYISVEVSKRPRSRDIPSLRNPRRR